MLTLHDCVALRFHFDLGHLRKPLIVLGVDLENRRTSEEK
jgi:hypothetical protein